MVTPPPAPTPPPLPPPLDDDDDDDTVVVTSEVTESVPTDLGKRDDVAILVEDEAANEVGVTRVGNVDEEASSDIGRLANPAGFIPARIE